VEVEEHVAIAMPIQRIQSPMFGDYTDRAWVSWERVPSSPWNADAIRPRAGHSQVSMDHAVFNRSEYGQQGGDEVLGGGVTGGAVWCGCCNGLPPCIHAGQHRRADPALGCLRCARPLCGWCTWGIGQEEEWRFVCCFCRHLEGSEESEEESAMEEDQESELPWPSALERGACSDEPESDHGDSQNSEDQLDSSELEDEADLMDALS